MTETLEFSAYDHVLSEPQVEAITLELDSSISSEPWRVARRRLTTALRVTLDEPVKGWRVRRMPYLTDVIYNLFAPDEREELSSKQAWELTHALKRLPDVVDADPSFVVLQDVVDTDEEPAVEVGAQPLAMEAPEEVDTCEDGQAPERVDPNRLDWCARLIDAPCAWILEPPPPEPGNEPGKVRGEGTRIGHPDSGYHPHTDYFVEPNNQPTRVRIDLEVDYVDGERPVANRDGGHGLSTGTVIMSSDATGDIDGIAPAAEIVPLRVTERRLNSLIPSPILFRSGVLALSEAILYATHDADCHVISISLGWFRNRTLHKAVKDAEANNVIVCAAAGNYTVIVAWPAAYPEVIAVAGCNAAREKWDPSASGPQVVVSGPAERVWVPRFHEGEQPPAQSSGTSFAVATVAGVASLWLAYHGRNNLLDRYGDKVTLSDVFRYVLSVSSDPFSEPVGNGFGAGIVNARRALLTPLPSVDELRAAPLAAQVAAAPAPVSPVEEIGAVFPDVPEETLRSWLAARLDVPPSELDERIAGMEDEVTFHIAMNPPLRDELATSGPAAQNNGAAMQAAPLQTSTASLATDQFSDQLQERLMSD